MSWDWEIVVNPKMWSCRFVLSAFSICCSFWKSSETTGWILWVKRKITGIRIFEFWHGVCLFSTDNFAATSVFFFLSYEGCDCGKQYQQICCSIVASTSSFICLLLLVSFALWNLYISFYVSAIWWFSFFKGSYSLTLHFFKS